MGLVQAGSKFVEEAMGALFPLFKSIALFDVYVLDAATHAHILTELTETQQEAAQLPAEGINLMAPSSGRHALLQTNMFAFEPSCCASQVN